MWIKDINSSESFIHTCKGFTLKRMEQYKRLEIRKHDVSTFIINYDEKGKPEMKHIKFCPYCGNNLDKED